MSNKPQPGTLRVDSPPKFEMITPIIKILPGVVKTFVLVSEKPQGYYTHWNGEHTRICTAHLGKCSRCEEKKYPRKWLGFLHCLCVNFREHAFLEITQKGRDDLEAVLSSDPTWKGVLVSVTRETRNPKSAVVFSKYRSAYAERAIPAEKDVMPTLRRRWRLEEED